MRALLCSLLASPSNLDGRQIIWNHVPLAVAEGSKGLHGGGGAFGRIRLLAAATALEGFQDDGLKLRETLLKHQRSCEGPRRSQRSPGGRASRSTSARRERSSFPRNSVSCVI